MKAPRSNRYRSHWAGELRTEDVGGRVGWPAGCTAAATTAA